MPDGAGQAPAAVEPLAPEIEPRAPEVAPEGQKTQALSTRQITWRRFKRHKPAIVSMVVLGILAVVTALAPYLHLHSYHTIDFASSLQGPSSKHWFGTDNLGRDEFARVIYGGRVSLLIGLSVAVFSGVIGTAVGALAGFYGRWVDQVLMRVTDLFLAIPFLVVAILGTTIIQRLFPHMSTVLGIVIILSLFFWMPNARIVRGVVLSLKEKEFVEAARASGSTNRRIITSHILPNALGPITVIVTLGVAAAILTESALSFLGFGVQPPTPTWGNMLNSAQNFVLVHPPMVWFPGLMILITVLAVNFIGDGLRDAFDPHQQLGIRM
jgi:peptide/nickel transport system permease protein